MPQDPADAYRRARHHLTGTSLLTATEQHAIREVFAYTDALEAALRLLQIKAQQAPDLGRLLAVLALAHDDRTLHITKAAIEEFANLNVHVDIAESETEVRVQATITPAIEPVTH